jgi:hypothetical protein
MFGGYIGLTGETGILSPGSALNISPFDLTQAISIQFQVTFTSASGTNECIHTYLVPLRIQ